MNVRLPACLFSAVLLAGCETIQMPQQRQQEAARQQNAALVAEERLRRVEGRMETAELESARLHQEIQALNQQMARLASGMQSLEAKQAQEIQRVIDQISGRVETLIKKQEASAPPPRASRGAGHEHIVEAGHTLSVIAKAYGTTVPAIKEANNLKSDSIRVGQKLFIPE